ncbi:hypothetical protein ACUOA8_31490, partial [Escherichia sp. SS-MK2]
VMTVMPMAYWTPMVAGLTTHLMLMNMRIEVCVESTCENNITQQSRIAEINIVFASTFNANFYPHGHDSNADGVLDTNGGWADDSLNVDELNITLDNGSKWVGSATTSANVDVVSTVSTDWYDVTGNSLYPGVVAEDNAWGRTIDNQVFHSEPLFRVTLNTPLWNT